MVGLPFATLSDVYESGRHLTESKDFYQCDEIPEGVLIRVGSGSYHFIYSNKNRFKTYIFGKYKAN